MTSTSNSIPTLVPVEGFQETTPEDFHTFSGDDEFRMNKRKYEELTKWCWSTKGLPPKIRRLEYVSAYTKDSVDTHLASLSERMEKLEKYSKEQDERNKELDKSMKEQDKSNKEQDKRNKEQDKRIKEQDKRIKEQDKSIKELKAKVNRANSLSIIQGHLNLARSKSIANGPNTQEEKVLTVLWDVQEGRVSQDQIWDELCKLFPQSKQVHKEILSCLPETINKDKKPSNRPWREELPDRIMRWLGFEDNQQIVEYGENNDSQRETSVPAITTSNGRTIVMSSSTDVPGQIRGIQYAGSPTRK